MLSWIAGGVAVLALADGPKDDIMVLAADFCAVESYRFTTTLVTEAGGGRDEGASAPAPTRGQYKRHLPMHVQAGAIEAFKDGDTFVYREGEGEWRSLEPASVRAGRGGRGGARGLFGLARLEPPHELFAGMAAKLADEVERVEVAEVAGEVPQPAKTVYKGALTRVGAEAFGGRGGFGRGGRGGGEVEVRGSYVIEVEAGLIVRARFEVTRSGTLAGRESELRSVQSMSFEAFGQVDYDLPEAALMLFEI